jgi:hypothetical protein
MMEGAVNVRAIRYAERYENRNGKSDELWQRVTPTIPER